MDGFPSGTNDCRAHSSPRSHKASLQWHKLDRFLKKLTKREMTMKAIETKDFSKTISDESSQRCLKYAEVILGSLSLILFRGP